MNLLDRISTKIVPSIQSKCVMKVSVLPIAYSIYCGVTRTYQGQFNLHKTNAANEELVISLINGREVQGKDK